MDPQKVNICKGTYTEQNNTHPLVRSCIHSGLAGVILGCPCLLKKPPASISASVASLQFTQVRAWTDIQNKLSFQLTAVQHFNG